MFDSSGEVSMISLQHCPNNWALQDIHHGMKGKVVFCHHHLSDKAQTFKINLPGDTTSYFLTICGSNFFETWGHVLHRK